MARLILAAAAAELAEDLTPKSFSKLHLHELKRQAASPERSWPCYVCGETFTNQQSWRFVSSFLLYFHYLTVFGVFR